MTPEKFVNAIDLAVGQSTVSGIKSILETPIGRQPDKQSIDLSTWYNNLSLPDKENLSDFQVTGRMNKLMHSIKNLDNISERGERSVAVGLTFPAANDLASGFDFNEQAKMNRVLRKPYNVNTTTGVIDITGLVPKKNLGYPVNATHAKITGGWARVDFGTGMTELQLTNQVLIPLANAVHNIVLTPTSVPAGTGANIFLLQIVFLQEINGDTYAMKNGEFNSLAIMAVS